MADQDYHLVTFDEKFLGFGSVIGPRHSTSVAVTRGGFETRTSMWAQPLRHYNVRNDITEADHRDLLTFVAARKGSTKSFVLVDPFDSTTASDHLSAHAFDDIRLGTGDGSRVTWYMWKNYVSDNGDGEDRYTARRRLSTTVDIKSGLDAVEKTGGGTDFTADNSLGQIVYNIPPAKGVAVFGGCSFEVRVRFDLILDEWLEASIDSFDSVEISAPMVEIKRPELLDIDENQGEGGTLHTVTTGTVQLSFHHGKFNVFTPTGAMNIKLPDAVTSSRGDTPSHKTSVGAGHYFSIVNLGSSTLSIFNLSTLSPIWALVDGGPILQPGQRGELFLNTDGNWRMNG